MKREAVYSGPTGKTCPIHCDWCDQPATGVITVGPGCHAGYCEECGDRAHRFQASLDPQLSQSSILHGTAWLPTADKPDLVINHPGRSPLTIRDHRQLKATALKELLPPAKLPRKSKAKKQLTSTEIVKDIARRRRAVDRDLRAVLKNPEGVTLAEIAEVVGVPARDLEQLAS